MPFNSATGWIALGVALLAGWLFGLASSNGGRKWKRQLKDREVIIAKYRREMEAALVKARDRIRQLEQERDARPAQPPVDEVKSTDA